MMRDLYFKIAGWGRGEKCRIRHKISHVLILSKLNNEQTQLIELFNILANLCGHFSNEMLKLIWKNEVSC